MIQTIRLDSAETTYVLAIVHQQLPGLVYWGRSLPESGNDESMCSILQAPVFQAGLDDPYQLNIYPETGRGFRGSPALQGHRDGYHWAGGFTFVSMVEMEGGVVLQYEDKHAALTLYLEIVLDHSSNVLQRRSRLINSGEGPYSVQFCASLSQQVPSFCTKVMKFHGCWTGEFMTKTVPFNEGSVLIENRTGRTSHEFFPALIGGEECFSENSGKVYGMHLGWSGNFRCQAEHIADGTKQFQSGELFLPGEGILAPGEEYTSPWSYMSCSDKGMNGLSGNFHDFFRSKIVSPLIAKRPRPVQLNTWEAVYFDHKISQLREMATRAAELGVERFVLDDGWFHNRCDDKRALGDWWPDEGKYPGGLAPLCDHVKQLGMEFGIWFEPEMANEESELYRQHPDWVLHLKGFRRQRGRNQLVLNLCLPEVVDYLFDKISAILGAYPVDYVKWDMNRILTEPGNAGRAAVSDQTRAFYGLLERVRQAYPEVEIESCASGGGRVDYEVLKRTERFWASDSNDPFRRLQIQKGASLFFPPEVIGSHVGPEESHTSGRISALSFRAMVSLFYHFGLELNILELSKEEEQQVRFFIEMYKSNRNLLHSGRYYRLDNMGPNRFGYGVLSEDQKHGLYVVHQYDTDEQSANRSVLFAGLDPKRKYSVELLYPDKGQELEHLCGLFGKDNNLLLDGTYLSDWGLPLHMPFPGRALLLKVTATE